MRLRMMHSSEQPLITVFRQKILQSASHGPDLNARNAVLLFDRCTAPHSMCSAPPLRAASSNNRSNGLPTTDRLEVGMITFLFGQRYFTSTEKACAGRTEQLDACLNRHVARALRSSRLLLAITELFTWRSEPMFRLSNRSQSSHW
jgi:hypothetical protein